jgi:hypothetical protein
MSLESDVERAIASAKSWVAEQGWSLDDFCIASSELQSCPIGYVNIDVICCKSDDGDQFRRSRVLEVHFSTGKIENVLASRNPEQLKKIMDLERVKVTTEMMQQRLDEPQGEHSQERESDVDDVDLKKLLLEEVAFSTKQSLHHRNSSKSTFWGRIQPNDFGRLSWKSSACGPSSSKLINLRWSKSFFRQYPPYPAIHASFFFFRTGTTSTPRHPRGGAPPLPDWMTAATSPTTTMARSIQKSTHQSPMPSPPISATSATTAMAEAEPLNPARSTSDSRLMVSDVCSGPD